jgi:hypothetical protein
MRIEVAADGLTQPFAAGQPNARVALTVDVPVFMKTFVQLLTR